MIRAIQVKPLKQFLLLIRFENGEDRIYNCRHLLEDALFSEIADISFFNTVHVDEMGIVCWDDATDINPFDLYEDSEPVSNLSFAS